MTEYTEFDAREHETYMAQLEAAQAHKDHQPVAQNVQYDQPLKIWELSATWFEEDLRLEEVVRTTYAEWESAYKANPRNR